MKKLIAIGEALIDFIPEEKRLPVKAVSAFYPNVGGAPANVCGAFSRLGGKSEMITQLGNDCFGDKIIDEFKKYNIGCNHILRTDAANTSLAFVALGEDGNREFLFYRKPGADMLMSAQSIDESWFEDGYCLHFCSVSLGDFPMKEAHKKAVSIALNKNMLVSFDPNIRLPLWNDENKLRSAVLEFLPYAHIVKISNEETEFITGCKSVEEAKDLLFRGNTSLVVYTKGAKGAELYGKWGKISADGIKMTVADTTGAGDAFIGSFLYKLYESGINADNLNGIPGEAFSTALNFANKYAAATVSKKGALPSYPERVNM